MTIRVRLHSLFCGLSLCLAFAASAQVKPLSPGDSNVKAYAAKLENLQSRGTAALSAEEERQKTSECAAETNNNAIDACLGRELAITTKNYNNYAQSIREMLRLKDPDASAMETLNAPNKGLEFVAAERHWLAYRDTQCKASADIFFGGTIRPQIYTTCKQDLTRSHMHELASVYKSLWN